MKVLIWFLCLFANGIFTALLREVGITLGGIPTVIFLGGAFWLARTLCKKWDEHKQAKITLKDVQPTIETPPIRFCKKCGEELIENSKFCRKCGAGIVKEIEQ